MAHVAVAATVAGASHAAAGRPGEDWYAIVGVPDGRWTAAVVCDGCGSAAHAREGAQFISGFLARDLAAMAPDLDSRGPGEWTIDRVVTVIADMREAMRARFGPAITDYAATIVAAMVSLEGGFVLHIGDGAASAFRLAEAAGGAWLDLLARSDPENGEYVNETFYVTAPDWIRHVRVTPLSRADCLLLCTDGAQPLLYRGNEPRADRILDLLVALRAGENGTPDARLEAILAGADAARLSNDDKTVVLLARPGLWHVETGRVPGAPPAAAFVEPDAEPLAAPAGAAALAAAEPVPPQVTARAAPAAPLWRRPTSRAPSRRLPPPRTMVLLGALAFGPVGLLILGHELYQYLRAAPSEPVKAPGPTVAASAPPAALNAPAGAPVASPPGVGRVMQPPPPY